MRRHVRRSIGFAGLMQSPHLRQAVRMNVVTGGAPPCAGAMIFPCQSYVQGPHADPWRRSCLVFMPPEWLRAEALDENYFRLLHSGQSKVTTEEAAMLAAVFGEGGELPARQLS
jgi:hypothetical protein